MYENKCVGFNEVIWLVLKIENRSRRYDINRPRSRLGHKYTECKMCLSIMMIVFIKQHGSNIWSSVHEKF